MRINNSGSRRSLKGAQGAWHGEGLADLDQFPGISLPLCFVNDKGDPGIHWPDRGQSPCKRKQNHHMAQVN